MAIPTELGVVFTSTEIDDMKAAAQLIAATVRSKKILNLSNDEKSGGLSTVSDERLPYVHRSIDDYAVSFPNLNGQGYPLALAANDMATFGDLLELQTAMAEANEVVDEMRLVAGHFAFEFMGDQYYNAKRYLGKNVPGAQIVYDGLKGCFEGQGGSNAAPPSPGTGAENSTPETP